jgi:hypothetical protein
VPRVQHPARLGQQEDGQPVGMRAAREHRRGVDRLQLRRQRLDGEAGYLGRRCARALRMEACSPIVARHTAGAQDCEYEVA